jgi:hypothetical protein
VRAAVAPPSLLAVPPEQPRDHGAEQLARGALAVVEGGAHRYSKNWRPAPTLWIHQDPPTPISMRTVSPLENLAPACWPSMTMATTVASANDFRNCHEGRVQFFIEREPTPSQFMRWQPGWVMC